MSPRAQRIAIAEVCGYYQFVTYMGDTWARIGPISQEIIPNYLNDLNAMHEAETVLTPAQSERYAEFMLDVMEIPTPFIGTARCAYLTMHATAAQRAEAFLRTLNLWKDNT